ncbi:hypothetical protein RRG08_012916 [Elysia crispata]|uniref:Uncharacterized protein n=1 Tax=Elysia crispata TaxID=231223 RepID=A0AAE0ZZV4_9GAST|nr:hypothetical protein RRG08_012916 [Elysia crispata]
MYPMFTSVADIGFPSISTKFPTAIPLPLPVLNYQSFNPQLPYFRTKLPGIGLVYKSISTGKSPSSISRDWYLWRTYQPCPVHNLPRLSSPLQSAPIFHMSHRAMLIVNFIDGLTC